MKQLSVHSTRPRRPLPARLLEQRRPGPERASALLVVLYPTILVEEVPGLTAQPSAIQVVSSIAY